MFVREGQWMRHEGKWKVLPSGLRWSMPSLGPAPGWTRRNPAGRVPGSTRFGFGRKCLATPGGGSAVGSPEARSYESPGVSPGQRSNRAVWSSSHTGCANWGKLQIPKDVQRVNRRKTRIWRKIYCTEMQRVILTLRGDDDDGDIDVRYV